MVGVEKPRWVVGQFGEQVRWYHGFVVQLSEANQGWGEAEEEEELGVGLPLLLAPQ